MFLHSIIEITSKDICEDWFGTQVFDIVDLHLKELEFDVIINSVKLRELTKNVFISSLIITCYLDEYLCRNNYKQ